MLKKILVATDGSDHANKAVSFAADIAAKYGAHIDFIHVLPAHATAEQVRGLIDVSRLPEPMQAEFARFEGMQHQADSSNQTALSIEIPFPAELLVAVGDVLLEEAERTAAEAGVKSVDRIWQRGDPANAILAAAKERHADLIVLGTRGLSDLKGLFVGSVSHKVSHLATCTCVTVK